MERQSPLVLEALAQQYERMAQEVRAILAAREASATPGLPEAPQHPDGD